MFEALGTAEGVGTLKEIQDGAGAQFIDLVDPAMLGGGQTRQLATAIGDAETVADGLHHRQAAFLMAMMAGQDLGRRGALAQVVTERGETDLQLGRDPRGHVEHHHHMHPGVDLRVPFRGLGHAPETVDLGQQTRQGAAVAQHLEEARGPLLAERARHLLPDAIRHQGVDLAGGDHGARQLQGLIGDAETESDEARGQPRQTQDTHRILGEGRRDVAQDARFQIGQTAMRVDHPAAGVHRHGIDGEITPQQILFQRHSGVGLDLEAAIAGRGLALGAGERVFVLVLRVQEDREILADLPETSGEHLLDTGADHDIVVLMRRAPEQ